MISDIFLLLWSTITFVLWLVLLPLNAILSFLGLNSGIAAAMYWMFHPISYFGFWFNVQAFGVFIVNTVSFYTVWYIYRLVRMGISFARPNIEDPKVKEGHFTH